MGTPALTTRGFKEEQMRAVAEFIDRVLKSKGDEATITQVREEIRGLCANYPMPH
jgi:glycine hydroxymethyltransferase